MVYRKSRVVPDCNGETKMKIEKTYIDDLLIIYPDVYYDNRGRFIESYKKSNFETNDEFPNIEFIQDNISVSKKNVIRGLHYQDGEYAQDKLCQVLYGTVLDVAVDIRPKSKTYGKHLSIILSGNTHSQFLIPKGFAHGYVVLSDEAIFMYKVSNVYNKESERCVIYNDETLNIDWKIDNPILSEKDLLGEKFNLKAY